MSWIDQNFDFAEIGLKWLPSCSLLLRICFMNLTYIPEFASVFPHSSIFFLETCFMCQAKWFLYTMCLIGKQFAWRFFHAGVYCIRENSLGTGKQISNHIFGEQVVASCNLSAENKRTTRKEEGSKGTLGLGKAYSWTVVNSFSLWDWLKVKLHSLS